MAAQRRQFPIDFFSTFVSFDAVQCALENEMAVFSSIFSPNFFFSKDGLLTLFITIVKKVILSFIYLENFNRP